MDEEEVKKLCSFLSLDEILSAETESFEQSTKCWMANEDRNPRLALRPKSLEHLQAAVKFLHASTLDFAVRSTGTGSSSARDVVLDISAFDSFQFDQSERTVTVGAGQKWGVVYKKMDKEAPGYAVVGARQAYVGVAGSILVGGLSWLSSEFGMISDPGNLLDVQVVLSDGQCVWASQKDPELLWALRGGGGNFGVLTAVKLKAHPYATSFSGGIVMYPESSLEEGSRAYAEFVQWNKEPKAVCLAFLVRPGAVFFKAPYNGFGFFNFGGLGHDHAQSEAGFAWVHKIPGITDLTAELTFGRLCGFSDQDEKNVKGNTKGVLLTAIMPEIDAEMLLRASKWLDEAIEANPAFEGASFAIIEALGPNALGSTRTASETAWPHGKPGHVLQLGVGTALEHDFVEETAWNLIRRGRDYIAPQRSQSDFLPTFVDPETGPEMIYKGNYEKLTGLKAKYDAGSRFNKGVIIESKV